MSLKHYKDPHIAVAVAATAVVCSPKARAVLRRGVVIGLAGALRAGDALAAFARSVERGAQDTTASTSDPVRVSTAATHPPAEETGNTSAAAESAPGSATANEHPQGSTPSAEANPNE